jgi:hypothetical protein
VAVDNRRLRIALVSRERRGERVVVAVVWRAVHPQRAAAVLLAREETVGCGAAGEAEGAAHEGACEEGGHVVLWLWVIYGV